MSAHCPYHIAVDIGGTFTDLVAAGQDGTAVEAKALSTPDDPASGVSEVLARAAAALGTDCSQLLAQCSLFVLGTTIATNTMLELNGARVGLICTEGFRDDLAIRRGYIPRTKDFRTPFPPDLVPRYLRIGVRERIAKDGRVLTPLVEEDVVAAATAFRQAGVEAVAVCLFNAFLNPVHEERVRDLVARELPEAYVSLSSLILPVMGEYPRVSTTVVNAYVAPRTLRWLAALEEQLHAAGFAGNLFIMQNNGGIIDARLVQLRPVLTVLSGPAAGAPGAQVISADARERNLILFEMGGTSTDITILRDGLPLMTEELSINGYDVMTPAVDVHTVAAGGGAIAHVDTGGLLRVGPRSAGARPGPAALGRSGQEPTITDANLLLARLDPARYAGGEIPLYPDLARTAFAHIGAQLQRTPEGAALGAVQVTEAMIANAIKAHCLHKGVDPRQFALISAGGAGGLHAVEIARSLGIKRVYVPRTAPVFCAMGMLRAQLRRDVVRSIFQNIEDASADGLRAELDALRLIADAEMRTCPWPTPRRRYEYSLAMQYRGQMFQLDVPVSPALTPADLPKLREAFHQLHEERYGHRRDEGMVQVVRAQLTVLGELAMPPVAPLPVAGGAPRVTGQRAVTFSSGAILPATIYTLEALEAGAELAGPAVVEGRSTTILVPPDARATCDHKGTLIIDLVGETADG